MIFRLYGDVKTVPFSRNSTSGFDFDLFLGSLCVLDTLVILSSSSEPQLPVSHTVTKVSSQYSTVLDDFAQL